MAKVDVMEQAMNPIKHPALRNNLMVDLKGLYESGTATHVDLRQVESDLDFVIHFFYDDTSLSEDASKAVGWFLRSEEEAVRIREIVSAMDAFFAEFGMYLKDKHVLEDERWLDLMSAISRYLAAHWEEPVDLER